MVCLETQQDGVFGHDEADDTMVSYVLEAANSGKDVIRVLTDVFILLVYWVHRAGLQCKVQMEWWDGIVLDIKATCADLGPKCLQLLGMHALSGCDTTSYPFGKGKISALNTLLAGDFLADVLGEVGSTCSSDGASKTLLCFSVPSASGDIHGDCPLHPLHQEEEKPQTYGLTSNIHHLLKHVLRAHLQVMLWKAADHQAPPDESVYITQFGWDIQNSTPIPAVAQGAPAPPELVDVIQCQCKAEGSAAPRLAVATNNILL